jgi:hypothetical protein
MRGCEEEIRSVRRFLEGRSGIKRSHGYHALLHIALRFLIAQQVYFKRPTKFFDPNKYADIKALPRICTLDRTIQQKCKRSSKRPKKKQNIRTWNVSKLFRWGNLNP